MMTMTDEDLDQDLEWDWICIFNKIVKILSNECS